MQKLNGKKIAILVANGFEQSEMADPKEALEKAGAKTEIISPETGKVRGWRNGQWSDEFPVDVPLERAISSDYDALLLPGGVINPDKLRMNPLAVDFVKHMFKSDKPIAAICHGPLMLINAEIIKGYTVTSWLSIKIDLINAGANWVDERSVTDRKIVTSRKPEDIPYFNEAMIAVFAQNKL